MVGIDTRVYAMDQGRIMSWEKYATENPWVNEAQGSLQSPSDGMPEGCVAVYYVVDRERKITKLHVVGWTPEHRDAFKELNMAWVSSLYKVEKSDSYQWDNPQDSIIRPGGEIFFLLQKGEVVGTAAVLRDEEPSGFDIKTLDGSHCELGKMTVSSTARGKGFAHPLMHECLFWAKMQGFPGMLLLTDEKLTAAVSLYKRHGFQILKRGPHPSFERCTLIMYQDFKANDAQ